MTESKPKEDSLSKFDSLIRESTGGGDTKKTEAWDPTEDKREDGDKDGNQEDAK